MALTQVDQGLLGQYAQYTGFKNRIYNGQMQIDQRNAGASVSMSSGSPYILDRWRFWANGSGGSAAYTVQQSSVAPAGFVNSVAITQTASFSPTGFNYNIFAQYIEGYNVADLGWGTAYAQAVTLSFWVRSSLTGTFGGVVSNASQLRSYPFTYTISAANTWEYKTITIPGDTSGTWLTTNGIGLEVYWQLGVGSSYLGTAGAWAGATYLGATGATQITATNGATMYITGVQLEKGSTATSFDYRPYGAELALCQRYLPAFNGGVGDICNGGAYSTSQCWFFYPFQVQPRVAPTGITATIGSAPNTMYVYNGAQSSSPITGLTFSVASLNGARIQTSGSSGLTAGQYTPLLSNASSGLQILFTGCEL